MFRTSHDGKKFGSDPGFGKIKKADVGVEREARVGKPVFSAPGLRCGDFEGWSAGRHQIFPSIIATRLPMVFPIGE